MPRTPRRARPLGRAAALAVAGLALAACAQLEQAGAAAVVGGQRISVTQVQQEATDYLDALPADLRVQAEADTAQLQGRVLARLIDARVVGEVAREQGVDVSDGDIDRFVEEQLPAIASDQGFGDVESFLASRGLTTESARSVVYSTLVRDALVAQEGSEDAAQQVVDDVVERLSVEVNPRYGSWDGGLVAGTGSISTAAEG